MTDFSTLSNSLGHLLQQNCAQWPDKAALIVPGKGGRRTITYRELYDEARRWSAALRELGLQRGDRLALFSENCVQWALLDWAAQTLGVVTVPIYPSLPPEQVNYIVRDSGAKLLVAGTVALQDRVKAHVQVPIHQLRDGEQSIELLSRSAALDQAVWEAEMLKIRRTDLATIIYTSGTTGDPKGVLLPHRTFLHLCHAVRETLPINENDTFLSFLPLSHVYERMAGHFLPIACGATIAYAGSLASLATDMTECKPTIMLCVPRFLEAMRERILEGVAKQPPIRQKLFRLGLAQGTAKAKGRPAPLFGLTDKLVGKKIRERTGGKMRFFVSGGMAMPMHVFEFFSAFGLPILQGYGLTETCAGTCFNPPDRNQPDTVGLPIAGMEIRIAADGEILVRGPGVMDGYFNQPEATRESIDTDGWFHTGDIGEFRGDYLRITDRKKDLLVLGNGKNVAPQPIENKLRESPYISEAVLFGDGMPYVCAVVVPDFERIKGYLKEHGVKPGEPEEMIRLDAVLKLLKGEIDKVNKHLADFEKVKKHELLDATFSVESGELTPSLKVKRKVVREKFKDTIARMQRT